METAVALLAAVLFCYFLAKSQPFRSLMWKVGKIGGVVVLLTGAAVASYVLYQRYDEARRRKLIKPSEVVLSDLTFTNDYGTSYRLTGAVKNTSNRSLHSIGVTFVIRDCAVPFDPDKYIAESEMKADLATAEAGGDKELAKRIAEKIKAQKPRPGHVKDPWATPPTSREIAESRKVKATSADGSPQAVIPGGDRKLSNAEIKALGF